MNLSRPNVVLATGGRSSSTAGAALSERHGSTPSLGSLQTAAEETGAKRLEGLDL